MSTNGGTPAGEEVALTPDVGRSKTPSFQITSVYVGGSSQASSTADGGNDSADDPDGSDISEPPSCSTGGGGSSPPPPPRAMAMASVPVIPTSSRYGLAIVGRDRCDEASLIKAAMACADNIACRDESVSVTATGSVMDLSQSRPRHASRNERFRLVKIESTEPFRCGRWMCMDYLDHNRLECDSSTGTVVAVDNSSHHARPIQYPAVSSTQTDSPTPAALHTQDFAFRSQCLQQQLVDSTQSCFEPSQRSEPLDVQIPYKAHQTPQGPLPAETLQKLTPQQLQRLLDTLLQQAGSQRDNPQQRMLIHQVSRQLLNHLQQQQQQQQQVWAGGTVENAMAAVAISPTSNNPPRLQQQQQVAFQQIPQQVGPVRFQYSAVSPLRQGPYPGQQFQTFPVQHVPVPLVQLFPIGHPQPMHVASNQQQQPQQHFPQNYSQQLPNVAYHSGEVGGRNVPVGDSQSAPNLFQGHGDRAPVLQHSVGHVVHPNTSVSRSELFFTPPTSRTEKGGSASRSAGALEWFDEEGGGSTGGGVAIDNKIEQAMDLVKSHLMFAVREEVEVLRERIAELTERIAQLEGENAMLRSLATQEVLAAVDGSRPPQPQPPATGEPNYSTTAWQLPADLPQPQPPATGQPNYSTTTWQLPADLIAGRGNEEV